MVELMKFSKKRLISSLLSIKVSVCTILTYNNGKFSNNIQIPGREPWFLFTFDVVSENDQDYLLSAVTDKNCEGYMIVNVLIGITNSMDVIIDEEPIQLLSIEDQELMRKAIDEYITTNCL